MQTVEHKYGHQFVLILSISHCIPFHFQPTLSPSKTPSVSPSASPTTAAPTDAPTLNEVASIFDEESYVSAFGCINMDPIVFPRAIDGSTDKYFCDRTEATETPGFTIIPSHNKLSIAKALRVYSSNECSGCDPVAFSLEGRSDPEASWTVISSGDLPWAGTTAPGRNFQGQDVISSYGTADTSFVYTEVVLSNDIEYLHYKLSFQETRDINSNSLQFAEVELAGVLYEDYVGMQITERVRMESELASNDSFVQAVTCPAIGSSKVTASGLKLIEASAANTYCGIFIQTASGALIPYARSYNGFVWESSPGPFAAPSDSFACPSSSCITLPDLEDSTASYIIIAKDGTSSDIKDIARFLQMTTFGPKMNEVESLALNGSAWGEVARASYVRAEMDKDKSSHREWFRRRANPKWDVTTQEATSDHPCSPNSKWRRYSFTPHDRYKAYNGDDVSNEVTFEEVPTEAGLTATIYEADREEDVSAHGTGVFRDSTTTTRIGFSGSGFYDFGSSDYLEFNINVTAAGPQPISFRYSVSSTSYDGNRACQLWVNDVMVVDKYDFVYTDGSSYWMYSDLVSVDLVSGTNKIKLVAAQPSGPEIDFLQLGKLPAVLIKQNGHPRAIAKNGLHLLDDFEYELFTDPVIWADYPYPPLGDLTRLPYGRAKVSLPDGRSKTLDSGNVSDCHLLNIFFQLDYTSHESILQPRVDWTGYEEYLPEHYFIFDGSVTWDETSSDLFSPYTMHKGDELLLRDGYDGPICDLVPPYAGPDDAPIFAKMADGTWVQWTPKVQVESNGPSINDVGDLTENVLSNGGGGDTSYEMGTVRCANVARSFVNEDTCFLSNDITTCSFVDGVNVTRGHVMVCGSLGEVANDPSLPETYGIQTEEFEVYKDDVLSNQKVSLPSFLCLYADLDLCTVSLTYLLNATLLLFRQTFGPLLPLKHLISWYRG